MGFRLPKKSSFCWAFLISLCILMDAILQIFLISANFFRIFAPVLHKILDKTVILGYDKRTVRRW